MSERNAELKPPVWAEHVLRLLLKPEDRESVSGDLLEEYRESVCPSRGRAGADLWYVGQVTGFLWRAAWPWGVLFSASFVGRTALDWFDPPADFRMRASVTTFTAVSLFVAAGFWAAWRARSLGAAALTAIGTSIIAAIVSISSALVMLAIWHDPQTFGAIDHSGGLGEVFTLPLFVIVPGTVCALVGGIVGRIAASVCRSHVVE